MASELLSAEWINEVIAEVSNQVEELVDMIFESKISSGYLVMEQPVDEDMASRMTPEQFQLAMMQGVFEAPPEMADLRALAIAKGEYLRANPPS